MPASRITSPDDPALISLCAQLVKLAPDLDREDVWPAEQLQLCAGAGVFEWFLAEEHGGQGWSEAGLLRGYVQLAAACLTTTFVLTQRVGAVQRIAAGSSDSAREELLPDLIAGQTFATVGISHLTTSRRHLAKPVLQVWQAEGGFVLDGFSPWVTGAAHAETVVLGATLGGATLGLVKLEQESKGMSRDSNINYAAGLQAGILQDLSKNASIEAGYRYLRTNVSTDMGEHGGPRLGSLDLHSSGQAYIGANYKF